MFIKYKPKAAHVKTIPVVIKSSGGEAVPLANDSVILRPGTNELTERQWKAIQPHVQDEIKNKIIVPFSVEVKKDGDVTKARTLKDAPVSVARKIIESCQNVADLKKWVRQELPDEMMLLVLKRLRKLKIDPDEFGDEVSGEEDTLDADITPEGGDETTEGGSETEPEAGAEVPEDTDGDETGGEGSVVSTATSPGTGSGRRGRKKDASGKNKLKTPDPESGDGGDKDETEEDEDEIPDFDGSGGKE